MESVVTKYFDPEEPGSFSGLAKFRKHTKVSYEELAKLLSGYPSYTLHRPVKKRFTRNRTVVGGLHHTWQVDLSDMQAIQEHNDGFRYLLVAIDVLSKQLFVEPLKRKTPQAVVEGFQAIFRRTPHRPLFIHSDKGKEFTGNTTQQFFKNSGIHFYVTHDEDTKSSIAERVQRTLKSSLYRIFTHLNTYRYIDVLPQVVSSYNNSYHRSIRMTPNEVTKHNEVAVRHRLYPVRFKPRRYKFRVGDFVRIPKTHSVFRKGFEAQWTEEFFKVRKRFFQETPAYRLEDLMGEEILGTFYEDQLQKVIDRDNVFIVDRVLKRRQRRGKTEYFVRWRGWPEKFNSWTTHVHRLKTS